MNKKIFIIIIGMIFILGAIAMISLNNNLFSITSQGVSEDSPEVQIKSVSGYVCDKNTYDCENFRTQAEAQGVLNACGGAVNDVHMLDKDNDGVACEMLLYEMVENPDMY